MAYQSELEKLQRRYEEKPSQWFAALAEEHRRAGEVEFALQIVREGLEERSNYVSGHIVLARCLLDQKEDTEAQQVLERVLELDPENVIALKVLSEIAERRDDPAAARAWLERLLEVDPMNDEGRQRLESLADAEPSEAPERPSGADLAAQTEAPAEEAPAEEAAETEEVPETAEESAPAEEGEATPEPEGEPAEIPSTEVELVPVDEAALEAAGSAVPVEEAPEEVTPDAVPVEEAPEEVTPEEVPMIAEDLIVDHAGPREDKEAEPVPVETGDLGLESVEFQPPEEEIPVLEEIAAPEGVVEGEPEAEPVSGFEPTEQVPAIDEKVLEEKDVKWVVEDAPDEAAAEAASGVVEHYEPVELSAEAGEGPPPEDLVGAQVERPEPIELDGGPGMVIETDQSKDLDGGEEEQTSSPWGVEREPMDIIEFESPPEEEAPAAAESVEPEPEPVADAAPEPEPEPEPEPVSEKPVVTETMAEVYVKQGLVEEALSVYRELLGQRPGDAGLEARIAELEAERAPAVEPQRPRYLASETGGRSTRAFLSAVLEAGAGEATDTRSPDPLPEEPTPMESAFQAEEIPGAPTQPAPDGASLASVFGDEPPPPPPPPPPAPDTAAPEAPGPPKDGVSFDEFFGGSAPPKPPEGDEPSEENSEAKPKDDDFKDWLKGLKS